HDAKAPASERFRAHAALAAFDRDNPSWDRIAPGVVKEMLADNPLYLAGWMEALRPVGKRLIGELSKVFREGSAEQKQVAALVLADYAGNRPDLVAELLLDADTKQYAVLEPVVARYREQMAERLQEALTRKPEAALAEKERLARQQATAGVMLLLLGQPDRV